MLKEALLSITLIFAEGCARLPSTTVKSETHELSDQVTLGALSEREHQSFASATAKIVTWNLSWLQPKLACHNEDVDLVKDYQKRIGSKIKVDLLATSKFVFAYFNELHFRIVYLRVPERGLVAFAFEPYCAKTFEEAREWFTGTDTSVLKNGHIQRFDNQFIVNPVLSVEVEAAGRWTTEKERHYTKIYLAIVKDIMSTICKKGKAFKVTLPHFDMDDFKIYFVVEDLQSSNVFLGQLKWGLEDATSDPVINGRMHYLSEVSTPDLLTRYQAIVEKVRHLLVKEFVVNCNSQ